MVPYYHEVIILQTVLAPEFESINPAHGWTGLETRAVDHAPACGSGDVERRNGKKARND